MTKKEFVLDTIRLTISVVSAAMAVVIAAEATKIYTEMYF